MDTIDKNIKYIWNKIKNKKTRIKSKSCPNDEILLRYIDGLLDAADSERIQQHLLVCDYCLDLIHLDKKLLKDEAYEAIPDVPKILIERAVNLCSKEKDARIRPVDIVLKLAKDIIEVIENSGKLAISYEALPVPLRGGEKKISSNLITLRKIFSHRECEVQIENIGAGYANMRIGIKDTKSGSPSQGIRISLLNPHRETASSLVKNGEAFFSGIEFGEYIIIIKNQGKNIGQISVNIKE